MSSTLSATALLLWSAIFATPITYGADHAATPTRRARVIRDTALALPNAQRTSAGRMVDGRLRVSLDVVDVLVQPEGPRGRRVAAVTFAERGTVPTLPGPLLRVAVGTVVQVSLHNTLTKPVQIRGLSDRVRGDSAIDGRPAFHRDSAVLLAPGETREVTFTPSRAVSSFYYARVVDSLTQREPPGLIGDILGALVIDPANTTPDASEELFVVTLGNAGLNFNGLRWPHTPRLRYAEGAHVRWRVINASGEYHPLHLHGFYFQVHTRGDAQVDTSLAAPRPLLVTEGMREYSSMRLEWTAERPGNWLFHCHLLVHSTADPAEAEASAPASGTDSAAGSHDGEHGMAMDDGMAGLIMGITITPRPSRTVSSRRSVRRLDLWTSSKPGVFGDSAALSFVLQQGTRVPAPDSMVLPSSPVVLTRGEPTRIVVHNRLRVPLALHWHGMELDSYDDGVGHWSGAPGHVRPPILPGDSMEVHITPPRAGTFMYHIHGERGAELQQGLYGALVVVEPGRTIDRGRERLFVLASRGAVADAQVAINGRGYAPIERFVRGRTYRLRLMHISTNDVKTVRLLQGNTPVRWRAVAQDGAELPPTLKKLSNAVLRLDVGQTFDFEWTPVTDGAYVLEVATAPLLSAPEMQRLPFGVGAISDSALRVAATGTSIPLADSDRLSMRQLSGVFRHADGEFLGVWAQAGGMAYTRTRAGQEGPPTDLVALPGGVWVPGAQKEGMMVDVREASPHRLSAQQVVIDDASATRRVYDRIAAFPLTADMRARFGGRFEQGVSIQQVGDSLTMTGLTPAPLVLLPVSPTRLQLTFPDGSRFLMHFDGGDGPFTGFTVLGVGFSVKRVSDAK